MSLAAAVTRPPAEPLWPAAATLGQDVVETAGIGTRRSQSSSAAAGPQHVEKTDSIRLTPAYSGAESPRGVK
jgi:hypothetical protein